MEGILVINKPSEITSFDVIRKLRKILNTKKIGHTGTLDPLATGVMVLCVGDATKMAQDIENDFKEYEATLRFGIKTNTLDITGEIISEIKNPNVSIENLEDSIKKFVGDIKQVPPMFSAIKIDGQKLYKLARKGIEIERQERSVKIEKIDLLSLEGDTAKILCRVSKGTYIRTLIDDIGDDLKVHAAMTDLNRTKVGNATLEDSYTLEEIEKKVENSEFNFLMTVEKYFNYPRIDVDDDNFIKIQNGRSIKINNNDGRYKIYNSNNFVGFAEVINNLLKRHRYFK